MGRNGQHSLLFFLAASAGSGFPLEVIKILGNFKVSPGAGPWNRLCGSGLVLPCPVTFRLHTARLTGGLHLLLALQTFCRHTHTSFWSLFIALVLPCAPQPPPAAGTQMQGCCRLSCAYEAVCVSSISSSVIGTVTSELFEDH